MRICVVSINYEPEKSGIGPYTTGMAVGLAARGHDVQVMTGLPHYPEWLVNAAYREASGTVVSKDGVVVRRFSHYVPSKPSIRRRLLFEASFGARVVASPWGEPDVVLTTSPSLVASAMVVARCKSAKLPVGIIVQDLYGKGVMETGALSGRAAALTGQFEAATLKKATGLAVVHERFAAAAIEAGVDQKRVTVIRNWAHVAVADDVDTARVRKKHGWTSTECIVVHSGNMGVKQGLENVIAAARIADRQCIDIRFVLLGDGNRRKSLELLAQGVRCVEFKDPLEASEYRAVLASADVLLVNELPGVGEMAVPSKLTSYFAAGRPIVAATDREGVTAQEIRDSGAGVVVPAGDPVALLEASLSLLRDSASIVQFGDSGQKYARRLLGVDQAIDGYEDWALRLIGTASA